MLKEREEKYYKERMYVKLVILTLISPTRPSLLIKKRAKNVQKAIKKQ